MNHKNKSLRRSASVGTLLFAVGIGTLTGCQGRQLSWMVASNATHNGLTERQISVAQTPLATAQREAGRPKADDAISTPASYQTSQPAAYATPSQASPAQPAPVQQASANSLRGQDARVDSIQPALYVPSPGATSQVVPVQYTTPNTTSRNTTSRYTPIGASKGSENIPRIAMGTPAMPLPPAVPPGQPNIPRTQLASHARSHGANASSGCGCSTCKQTGAYKPFYPRFSGNVGCGACGSSSCSGECGGCMVDQGFAVPQQSDPQEYIFDGGDQDPQVRLRSDLTQVGLDPEDTVIQYETMDGKTNVESGCRVAIYAPRFASVRKRTSVREKELALRAKSTSRPDGPDTLREQLPTAKVTKPVKAANSENVRVVEAFRERNRPQPAELILPMVTISDAFKPYEDLSLIRNGDLKATDLAKLAKSAAAARTWTNVDELNVIIDGQEAIEAVGAKTAADVTLYEHKGARIRLCKVASEQMANPGDIISFTIRFDNVGEQPLNSLVITDSLAPRLEYVEKSQQASVPANFSITPNVAGSSILRWELEKGLKPGDGGLVRFSCKVR